MTAPGQNDPLGDKLGQRIRCPKDGTIMERVTAAGVIVDRCAGCGAIWFDALELRQVLDTGDIKATDTGKLEDRPHNIQVGHNLGGMVCPRDGEPLIKARDLKQKHVEIDACRKCAGVLLDAGELTDLSEFTLGERIRGLLGRGNS